jgi:hypothetical protein
MIDHYTRAVLTVIAACLVILVVREFSPVREARSQSNRVHIDSVSSFAFQYAGPLHVICDSGCK